MPHLIETIKNESISGAIAKLKEAQAYIVKQAKITCREIESIDHPWGIKAKRLDVNLKSENRPVLVGKESEKLTEVFNISATVERLIAALEWFEINHPEYSVQECHPSTSQHIMSEKDDDGKGNDLVLMYGEKKIIVEVCDVVSSNAGANGKEKKDLESLGCGKSVPEDQIERYICTSNEFAKALIRPTRKWKTMHYRYDPVFESDTHLLHVIQPG
jgi:hypothetical protein